MVNAKTSLVALLAMVAIASVGHAGIIKVIETDLGADTPAIIEPGGAGAAGVLFGEDVLTFSDRTHQHNGAAFDDGGTLSTSGTNVVPLPDYLVGGEYVRFANDARDNGDYSATVIADQPMTWYLLVDNRVNGPVGDNSSPNSTDPELGGSLQWVIDGNWQRVNTGLSPNGQPDYTGVDEGGDGIGPGQGLNQFYSVFRFPLDINVVTVFNNGFGGNNMISLVAVPEPTGLLLLSLGLMGLWITRRGRR
jgi:hypothetical protein